MATTQQRTLKVTMPFEECTGGRMGAVRIVTAAPYNKTDHYLVKINEEETEAVWMKENGDKSTHVCDLDMQACDCAGYGYRRTCRHLAATRALKMQGKI